MKLSEKQQLFTSCIGQLIHFSIVNGYGLTVGDAYRDPRVHGDLGVKKSYSSSKSNHKVRLAMDFNLFVGGKYITSSSHPAYKELGSFWKGLNPWCAWGGDFTNKDGNHFSFEHNGVK